MKFKITEWTPKRTGSLYGFASVTFDDYLSVLKIAIRDGKNGLWAGLPSSSWVDRNGKTHYDPVVLIPVKERQRAFSDTLIAKLQEMHPSDF